MSSQIEHLLAFDAPFSKRGKGYLAGVDEAGRGPLAGPVVAAAVILVHPDCLTYLNDSKKILPKKREILYAEILQNAQVGLGVVFEEQIDKINIYQATRLAMKKAVLALNQTPEFLLIDGKMNIDLPIKQNAVVKGDAKSASIAAASIIAKVYRDAWMRHLDMLYPVYGFKKHKGYGTREHVTQIHSHGPSPVHRKSFEPIQTLVSSVGDKN